MTNLRIFSSLSWLLIFVFTTGAAASADEIRVINAGIGGNNSRNLLARIDSDVLRHRPDLVILMVGSNDMLNSNNAVPLAEYEKNLDQLAAKIVRSGSKLVLMTLLPCHTPYLFDRHPEEFYGSEGPEKRIELANRIIRRFAAKRHLPLVEANRVFAAIGEIGVSPKSLLRNEANSGSRDGVHPTPEGYRVLVAAIFQTLLSQELAPKTVVCFGDSVTFGAHVQGAGTATGETYPALLRQLLNR